MSQSRGWWSVPDAFWLVPIARSVKFPFLIRKGGKGEEGGALRGGKEGEGDAPWGEEKGDAYRRGFHKDPHL